MSHDLKFNWFKITNFFESICFLESIKRISKPNNDRQLVGENKTLYVHLPWPFKRTSNLGGGPCEKHPRIMLGSFGETVVSQGESKREKGTFKRPILDIIFKWICCGAKGCQNPSCFRVSPFSVGCAITRAQLEDGEECERLRKWPLIPRKTKLNRRN